MEHICRSVYVRTTWNTFVGVSTCAPRGPHLLRRRVNICSRHCNLASGYDVDHLCAAWLGRIGVLMLPIPDPFFSYNHGPYPFRHISLLIWELCGQTSRIVPKILLVKWVVQLDNLRNPEADTLFRIYDGGHWHIELIHASSLSSVSQTALKLFSWERKYCHLHYISAVMPLIVSWVSFWKFWELLRHSTCLLLVWFSRNCSVAIPDFEVSFPLVTSFVNLHHFSVLVGAYACFH